MFKSAKTFLLMAIMGGLFLGIGSFWGEGGLMIGLILAVVMNVGSYWFSDKLAIKMARAEPIERSDFPDIYEIVERLSMKAGEPMPKLFMSPSPQLNAFATGRNPKHSAVCVNRGLYEALNRDELEGVLAHELQHVYNRDILIGSVAATMAVAIMFAARMAMWGAMLGRGGRDRGGNAIGALLMMILAPMAAMLIRSAISRSRESLADRTGAELSEKPLALASALRKLEAGANSQAMVQRGAVPAETSPAFQHMYTAAPFGGGGISKLFSSHPPIPERVAQLENMARERGQLGPDQSLFG